MAKRGKKPKTKTKAKVTAKAKPKHNIQNTMLNKTIIVRASIKK